MSSFDAFPPAPVMLDVGGESLEITPIRVGEVPALIKAVRPFAGQLSTDPDWLVLLAEHGESLIGALAVAARRERAWVDRLSLEDAVRLAAALFEVNADFFVQRLAPAVQHAAAQVNGRLNGAMPSTVSSAPGTASPIS